MISFLIGVGVGTTMGAVASNELRALAYRLYHTVKLWCTQPPE